MAVLDTVATALLVCFRWLARRSRILGRDWTLRVTTYPSKARSRFGDGRLGEVRLCGRNSGGGRWGSGHVRCVSAGCGHTSAIARWRLGGTRRGVGSFTWLVDFAPTGGEDTLEGESGRTLFSERGRFLQDPPGSAPRCPEASASFFRSVQKAPDLSDGGLRLPHTPDGLYHFETPLTFAACKAVTLGDARHCCLTAPKKIIMKLHVNWGHASAQQMRRVLVDSEGNNAHLLTCVGEVLAGLRGGATCSGGGDPDSGHV